MDQIDPTKQSDGTIETVEDDYFDAVISTEDQDSDGDIILQDGLKLDEYMPDGPVFLDHMTTRLVGRTVNVRREGRKTVARIVLKARGVDPTADRARELIKRGDVTGISVGFRILKHRANPAGRGFVIERAALREISVVVSPANANARISEVRLKRSTDMDLESGFHQIVADAVTAAADGAATKAAETLLRRLKMYSAVTVGDVVVGADDGATPQPGRVTAVYTAGDVVLAGSTAEPMKASEDDPVAVLAVESADGTREVLKQVSRLRRVAVQDDATPDTKKGSEDAAATATAANAAEAQKADQSPDAAAEDRARRRRLAAAKAKSAEAALI